MLYLTNINLNQNELQNAVIQPLATAPSNPKLGQIYCNSATSKIMWYNGTNWKTIGVVVESSATNGHITVDGEDTTIYELPIATTNTVGGVKVGTGLNVAADGTLTINASAPEWDTITGKPTDLVQDDSYVHTDNNYTTIEKNKLAGIATGAEENVQSDWNQTTTGADDFIKNKPTALSAFTNDEGFIDNTVANLVNYYTKTNTYTKTEVNNLIGQISTITITVVASLPATGQSNVIYLVAKPTADGTTNVYDEYLWVASTNKFEKIGDTTIDLSNYLQKTGDGSNVTATFTAAVSRALPATGEKISIIVGKIVKYLTDLKTVAFSADYESLINRPTLLKYTTFSLTTSQTTASKTITGSDIQSVMVKDSVTNDIVYCDVDITDMVVTVTVASTPTNKLDVFVIYS